LHTIAENYQACYNNKNFQNFIYDIQEVEERDENYSSYQQRTKIKFGDTSISENLGVTMIFNNNKTTKVFERSTLKMSMHSSCNIKDDQSLRIINNRSIFNKMAAKRGSLPSSSAITSRPRSELLNNTIERLQIPKF
jgi:hypothetical protein